MLQKGNPWGITNFENLNIHLIYIIRIKAWMRVGLLVKIYICPSCLLVVEVVVLPVAVVIAAVVFVNV